MNSTTIKSSSDGATLTFTVISRSSDDVAFDVQVITPWFSGRAPASTFMNGSPSAFFKDMATSWRGWSGAKTWEDLECRVQLIATSDALGHVSLVVELEGQDYDTRLRAKLLLDAGQLEGAASSVEQTLGA